MRCDAGGYPGIGTIEPGKMKLMACGPYRVPAVSFAAESVVTNHAPTGAYRGPGRAEATAALERTMDLLALELGVDPVEIRRRNLLRADEFPHRTVTGAWYDSGDHHRGLDLLLDRAGYDDLRAEQARRRCGPGALLGVGLATVIDSTAWAARSESASVTVRRDGTVEVVTGTASAGQEHPTVFARLVARALPVGPGDVVVVEGDTGLAPDGDGTMGSRSIQVAGQRGAAGVRTGGGPGPADRRHPAGGRRGGHRRDRRPRFRRPGGAGQRPSRSAGWPRRSAVARSTAPTMGPGRSRPGPPTAWRRAACSSRPSRPTRRPPISPW